MKYFSTLTKTKLNNILKDNEFQNVIKEIYIPQSQ